MEIMADGMSLTISGPETALLIRNSEGSWMEVIGMLITAPMGIILLFFPSAKFNQRAVRVLSSNLQANYCYQMQRVHLILIDTPRRP